MQWCEMMPHRHCLEDNLFLMYGLSLSDIITIIEYFFISYALHIAAKWGVERGHWRKLCNALALVFIFCSSNYAMNSIVIYQGCYWLQLIVSWLGVLVSFKALYHIAKIGNNALGAFMAALRITVKNSRL